MQTFKENFPTGKQLAKIIDEIAVLTSYLKRPYFEGTKGTQEENVLIKDCYLISFCLYY